MFDSHPNFAESIIAAVPVNSTQGTDFEVMPGDGIKFAQRMPVTLCPPETEPTFDNAEIGYLTTKSGDQIVIERGQEGSIAKPVEPGWRIIGAITRKTLTDIENASGKVSEAATGPVSGQNASFNSQDAYAPGSLVVYLNGLRQRAGAGADYTETSDSSFMFASAPSIGDYIHIEYNRA